MLNASHWLNGSTALDLMRAHAAQWELFLKHIVRNDSFPWDLKAGARGVQLAEKGLESWEKRTWVNLPEL